MKKILCALILFAGTYAYSMEKELINTRTGKKEKITFVQASHWSDLQDNDTPEETARKIHWQCKHDAADWYDKIWNNPDQVTPELLDMIYDLEKKSLKDPHILEVKIKMPRHGIKFSKGSTTIEVLTQTVIGYFKQLKKHPDQDQLERIMHNIVTLYSSRYYTDMAPYHCRNFLADKLIRSARKYAVIKTYPILETIITGTNTNSIF